MSPVGFGHTLSLRPSAPANVAASVPAPATHTNPIAVWIIKH